MKRSNDELDSRLVALSARLRLALPLLGRVAHTAKTLLAHYVIWKLRTGYTNLP